MFSSSSANNNSKCSAGGLILLDTIFSSSIWTIVSFISTFTSSMMSFIYSLVPICSGLGSETFGIESYLRIDWMLRLRGRLSEISIFMIEACSSIELCSGISDRAISKSYSLIVSRTN